MKNLLGIIRYLLLLAALQVPSAVWADVPSLILKTQGNPTGDLDIQLGDAPAIALPLRGWFNGVATTRVIFPEPKQLTGVRVWLTLFNNPIQTPLFIEVRLQDTNEIIATSFLTNLTQFSGSFTQATDFYFGGTNVINLNVGTGYTFVLRGSGAGHGGLGASRSTFQRFDDTQEYFEIYGVPPQSSLFALNQFKENGTPVKEGRGITTDTLVFKANVSSRSQTDQARLQVELRPFDQPFSGNPTLESGFVPSGTVASVFPPSLTDGQYHWRARAIDEGGNQSAWQELGTEGSVDFVIATSEPAVAGYFSDGTFPNGYCNFGTTSIVPERTIRISSVDFWALCANGLCYPPNDFHIYDSDGTTLLAESDGQGTLFGYPLVAHMTQAFSGNNRITLLTGHTYKITPRSHNGQCVVDTFNGQRDTFYLKGELAAKNSIIIVPGIMGSKLVKASDSTEVWPNVHEMVFSGDDGYLRTLKLDSSGGEIAGQEVNPSGILRQESILGITWTLYGSLVSRFVTDGYTEDRDLFTVAYDWRRDLQSQVERLDSVLRTAASQSRTGKVTIIAHSRGGLLLKYYLAHSSLSQEVLAALDRVILVGVPNLGAPKALKVLNYGDDFDVPLGRLNDVTIKEIAQNMAGVYELLPSRRYVQVNGGYIQDHRNGVHKILDFGGTREFMLANPTDARNSSLLTQADEVHQQLDVGPIVAPSVFNLIGCGNPKTIGEIRLYDNGLVDITAANGDGTVPFTSAFDHAADSTKYFVQSDKTGINHNELISDERTVELIRDLAEDKPITLPEGISTATADCFNDVSGKRVVRFSTHSPVTLHIYDSMGRHTGPTVDGNIDLQIPDSTYERIAENSFAFVPAGDTYRVLARGLRKGEFTLKIQGYSGSSLTEAATYIAVPLASSATQAEVNFLDFQGDLTLKIDADGNGTPDANLQPTAVLQTTESGDVTPPDISVSPIPEKVIVGAPLTISVSASDDLSGVAVIRAFLDYAVVQNGQQIIIDRLGDHVVRLEAIDNAGNPATREIHFWSVYGFAGFLPPIDNSGSGIHNLGRSLPVKFRVSDYNGRSIARASARLFLSKISDGRVGEEIEAESTSSSNIGNSFRYDPMDEAYIFNLATRNLLPGKWQLRATLDDGESYKVVITLK